MGRQNYLPRSNSAFLAWAEPFSQRVNAAPEAVGLDQADADRLGDLVAGFAAAMERAADPTQRTRGTVAGRNHSRRELESAVRPLVQRIQHWPPLTDRQRSDLGLCVRQPARRRLAAPSTRPQLAVIYTPGGRPLLRIGDEQSPTRAARPPGAAAAEVFGCLGPNPPASLAGWMPLGIATRGLFPLRHPGSAPGQRLMVIARWFSPRGEFSEFSDPVSAWITSGLAAAA